MKIIAEVALILCTDSPVNFRFGQKITHAQQRKPHVVHIIHQSTLVDAFANNSTASVLDQILAIEEVF